ncbi:MAG: lactonase family protein, partial [Spirochaetaceae bacterium]|nr:lactonase family protein [Spirochaetaceae bacterium]
MIFAVGSYTVPGSRGISIYEWDESANKGRLISVYQDLHNPSYLCWDSSSRKLFAVSEVNEDSGAVTVFDIKEDGTLIFSGRQKGPGRAGCHIAVQHNPNRLFAASYSDGRLQAYNLDKGKIGAVVLNHSYQGHGPVTDRQASPHAHQALPDLIGQFLYVADLGSDIIWMHSLKVLDQKPSVSLEVPPGYGPRHLAFDSDGRHAYVLCELKPVLLVCIINPDTGKMTIIQELATVTQKKMKITAPAAVKLHPSGLTLAVSNRFDDTIAVFAISRRSAPDDGGVKLSFIDRFLSRGKTPRDITFSPDGSRLFIANQESHNICCRNFDAVTGLPGEGWGDE